MFCRSVAAAAAVSARAAAGEQPDHDQNDDKGRIVEAEPKQPSVIAAAAAIAGTKHNAKTFLNLLKVFFCIFSII